MQISVSGVQVTVVDLGFYSSYLSGYMIDKNGNVFSNRRGGRFIKIGHRDRSNRKKIIVDGRTFYNQELLRYALPFFSGENEDSNELIPGSPFKKFVVGNAYNPKIHDSRTDADSEALRLARAAPGTRFAVYQVVSTVCVGEVSWEKV
jgi:hypothetical protein